MTDRLFKAIVGDVSRFTGTEEDARLITAGHTVSPAPNLTGSPSEPREGESPIMEDPENPFPS